MVFLGIFALKLACVEIYLEYVVLSLATRARRLILLLDNLSIIFMLTVLFITISVTTFSVSYIAKEIFFSRFIFLVYVFVVRIFLLVLSPNIMRIILG